MSKGVKVAVAIACLLVGAFLIYYYTAGGERQYKTGEPIPPEVPVETTTPPTESAGGRFLPKPSR